MSVHSIGIAFIVFCTVLVCYIHVVFHLKTSSDLEMFDVVEMDKPKLETICDLRQPIILGVGHQIDTDALSTGFACDAILSRFPKYTTQVTLVRQPLPPNMAPQPIPILCQWIHESLSGSGGGGREGNEEGNGEGNGEGNEKGKILPPFISEKNQEFLDETGLLKKISAVDSFLRPSFTVSCDYDFIFGTASTPLRFEVAYRTFFYATTHPVRVKLFPPNMSTLLLMESDYDTFDFTSPINPWETTNKRPILHDRNLERAALLEITLYPSQFLFVPAYWWYSFSMDSLHASVLKFQYRTLMNNISILPQIGMYYLQMQNIKFRQLHQHAHSLPVCSNPATTNTMLTLEPSSLVAPPTPLDASIIPPMCNDACNTTAATDPLNADPLTADPLNADPLTADPLNADPLTTVI